MSIREQIEPIVEDLTGNNIPSEVVTIIKAYPDNTCDITSSNGSYRNVKCSGLVDDDKQGLLVFIEGKMDKPFVLLFNDLAKYYTKEEIDELIIGGGLTNYYTKNEVDNLLNRKLNVDEVLDCIYPIGSFYMSMNNVNPSELFGGEWEQVEGKFLLTSSNNYIVGDTGGSATVKLSESEIPPHTHGMEHTHRHRHQSSAYKLNQTSSGSDRASPVGLTDSSKSGDYYSSYDETVSSKSVTDVNIMDNVAHDNMPPYLVVNVWFRVA